MSEENIRFVRVERKLLDRYWPLPWADVVKAALDPTTRGIEPMEGIPDLFQEYEYQEPVRADFGEGPVGDEAFLARHNRWARNYGYAFLRQGEPPIGHERTFLFAQNWLEKAESSASRNTASGR